MASVSAEELDEILGLQLAVAWAGERACEPQRLGWWDTDVTDAAAGGDLFARLVPRTAAWAGLEMARKAALRVDARARERLAKPDETLSLFHFGFALDEALDDRLAHHKRHGHPPDVVLKERGGLTKGWDPHGFANYLESLGTPKAGNTPAGRQLKSTPSRIVEAAQALAAALVPLGERYPLPYTTLPDEW